MQKSLSYYLETKNQQLTIEILLSVDRTYMCVVVFLVEDSTTFRNEMLGTEIFGDDGIFISKCYLRRNL
jgi:hypothetical protein